MPTKVFVTGVTGYIGGDAFYSLQNSRRDFEFSALVRGEEKAQQISQKYPNLRIVIGELDDADKIAAETAWADIVIRMNPHLCPTPC